MDSQVQSQVMPDIEAGELSRLRILRALRDRWVRMRPPPTYRELAEELDMSTGWVQHHARELRDDGLLWAGVLWLTPRGHAETEHLHGD